MITYMCHRICEIGHLGGLFFGLLILEFLIFPPEPFNPTGGIHQFLLTGEKGVAFGADFDPYIFFRGSGLEYAAAGTLDGGFLVRWMSFRFHGVHSPSY